MENRAVPEYESANPLIRRIFHKRLEKAVAYTYLIGPRSLIDIGCGHGVFLETLLKTPGLRIGRVTGIDKECRVSDSEAKYPGWTFRRESILKSCFRDGEFELAVCLDVLEHIKEVERAIAEIHRVTKKGGFLITSQPTENFFYKLCRFLSKGVFSGRTGPASGQHYHKANQIDALIRESGYKKMAGCRIPLSAPFDLFHINLYRKISFEVKR